ncbi:MAG: hypothetical protein OES69_19020 [Myxococcales bacterium]|nr:hypothetical protein [Myxococcales bacterium]
MKRPAAAKQLASIYALAQKNEEMVTPSSMQEVYMVERTLLIMALALSAFGCGSSDASVCRQACDLIEEACMSTTPDCVGECSEDLNDCPDEMGAVLDCLFASELQCDPGQDQGLAEAPCKAEHDATALCGKDPF